MNTATPRPLFNIVSSQHVKFERKSIEFNFGWITLIANPDYQHSLERGVLETISNGELMGRSTLSGGIIPAGEKICSVC